MTKIELKNQMEKEEARIHDEIRKLYPNSAGLDGIISIDDYLDIKNPDSKPLKILWILKERGFPKNKINQEFDLREFMKCLGQYPNWKKTYGPMCWITEGILEWQRTKDEKYFNIENLFKLEVEAPKEYAAVNYLREDGYQVFPIDHIAFLNVKKLGSTKNTSIQGVIDAEYEKPEVKSILKQQFNYIDADIIIMGCHVKKLAEDFAGVPITSYTHIGEYGAHDYYYDSSKNKLFIFADHPSAIPFSANLNKNDYCNSIFNVIKKFSKDLLQ